MRVRASKRPSIRMSNSWLRDRSSCGVTHSDVSRALPTMTSSRSTWPSRSFTSIRLRRSGARRSQAAALHQGLHSALPRRVGRGGAAVRRADGRHRPEDILVSLLGRAVLHLSYEGGRIRGPAGRGPEFLRADAAAAWTQRARERGFSSGLAAAIPWGAVLLHNVPASRNDRSARTAGREPRAGRRYQSADGLPATVDQGTCEGPGSSRASHATWIYGGGMGRDTAMIRQTARRRDG